MIGPAETPAGRRSGNGQRPQDPWRGRGAALLRRRGVWTALVVGTAALAAYALVEIVLPAYHRPTVRSYETRLGYPALLRTLGRPLPVETTIAQSRTMVQSFLGEGRMASDPVQVPMVPVGWITAAYVKPGQRVHKGELLAELDPRKGRLAAEAAGLALLSSHAELTRVEIGSVTAENREQPYRDAIDVKALGDQVALLKEEVATKEKLYERSLVSKEALLESKRMLGEAQLALDVANLSLQMSAPAKGQSERIAANTMEEANLAYQEQVRELAEYQIAAPADGIVDRVLIHVGEYNQAPGTPAFVIAAGLWFQGYFDQSAVGEIVKGASAEVHLAARPDVTFTGKVSNVNPIVGYGTGGPDINRPVRPLGTDAPEWPATFQVRVDLDADPQESLVPGLTGFARVSIERKAIAVPVSAVASLSAGSGLVTVVHGSEWQVRRVRCGAISDGWVEMLEGIAIGDEVIAAGQNVLQTGDRIAPTTWHAPAGTGR